MDAGRPEVHAGNARVILNTCIQQIMMLILEEAKSCSQTSPSCRGEPCLAKQSRPKRRSLPTKHHPPVADREAQGVLSLSHLSKPAPVYLIVPRDGHRCANLPVTSTEPESTRATYGTPITAHTHARAWTRTIEINEGRQGKTRPKDNKMAVDWLPTHKSDIDSNSGSSLR